jgi:hypothetical protein
VACGGFFEERLNLRSPSAARTHVGKRLKYICNTPHLRRRRRRSSGGLWEEETQHSGHQGFERTAARGGSAAIFISRSDCTRRRQVSRADEKPIVANTSDPSHASCCFRCAREKAFAVCVLEACRVRNEPKRGGGPRISQGRCVRHASTFATKKQV